MAGLRKSKFADDNQRNKKIKEEVRRVGPEDEKYKLGYGLAGKGVKLPWYMEKKVSDKDDDEDPSDEQEYHDMKFKETKSGGKKTLEELREERLKRERTEKERERERALLMMKSKKHGGFISRRYVS